jgi:hypothetical protein
MKSIDEFEINVKTGEQLCQQCRLPTTRRLHLCPYKEEIHDGRDALCNCCHRCTRECLEDI